MWEAHRGTQTGKESTAEGYFKPKIPRAMEVGSLPRSIAPVSPSPPQLLLSQSCDLLNSGLKRRHLSPCAGWSEGFQHSHPPSSPPAPLCRSPMPSMGYGHRRFPGLLSYSLWKAKRKKYMFIVALMAIYFITVNYKLPRAVRWKTHILLMSSN